ncbi:MAG: hypothetical protein HQL71_12095 [Magnetococcales bacterium]|nr:hypothetical protein [Magnetococcales bacterium]
MSSLPQATKLSKFDEWSKDRLLKISYISLGCLAIVFLLISIYANPENSTVFDVTQPFDKEIIYKNFTPLAILFMAMNYTLISAFGYSLTQQFFAPLKNTGLFPKLVASFFIGYILSLGIIRIVSLFIPYKQCYPVAALTFLFITFYLQREAFKQSVALGVVKLLSIKALNAAIKRQRLFLTLFLLAFSAILLSQVTLGWFRYVSHGPYVTYAHLLTYWKEQGVRYFPFISQHYDKWLFDFFLTSYWKESFQPILSWWVTLGLIKISLWTFLVLTFMRFKISIKLSFLFALFLMLGNSTLLPHKYYVLFTSINPLFFIINSRIAGIAFLFFLVASLLNYHNRQSHLSPLFYILAGLGMSTSSIAAPLWAMVVVTFSGVGLLSFRKPYKWSKYLEHALVFSAIGGSVLLFFIPFAGTLSVWLRLVVVVGVLLLSLYWGLPRFGKALVSWRQTPSGGRLLANIVLFNVSVVVGLVLFGNIFINNSIAHSLYNGINEHVEQNLYYPKDEQRAAQRTTPFSSRLLVVNKAHHINMQMEIEGENVVAKIENLFSDQRIHRGMSDDPSEGKLSWDNAGYAHQFEYERGGTYFIAYYGKYILLWLFTYMLLNLGHNYDKPRQGRKEYLGNLFLLLVAAVPMFLFFMSFVDLSSVAHADHAKSRFIEAPVYLLNFICLIIIGLYSSNKMKLVVGFLAGFYSVVPFLATERLMQLLLNLKSVYWTILNTY